MLSKNLKARCVRMLCRDRQTVCASFVPEQVHLCCRQRGRGRPSLHTHTGVGLGGRSTRIASSLHHDGRLHPSRCFSWRWRCRSKLYHVGVEGTLTASTTASTVALRRAYPRHSSSGHQGRPTRVRAGMWTASCARPHPLWQARVSAPVVGCHCRCQVRRVSGMGVERRMIVTWLM